MDRFDEYPKQLQGEPPKMPWEESEASRVPWINGRLLGEFSSPTLLSFRKLLVRKNGAKGHYFDPLILAIDEVLTERQGE